MAPLLQLRRLRRLQVIDYTPLYLQLDALGLSSWREIIPALVAERLDPARHGDLPRWQAVLDALPHTIGTDTALNSDSLRVEPAITDPKKRAELVELLQQFHPWRKGPFSIHGIHIDTEWRSDWKWNRIAGVLDLHGKTVLDVGCGNGYYGWRMLGAGASYVIGIDPTLLYVAQYAAVRHFIGAAPNYVLPLRLEDLPSPTHAFDVVFSMGVLYHRRDPLEHLRALAAQLNPGGTLVLETLIVEDGELLVPGERYAKMKNVWTIPSIATALRWLEEAGFSAPRCIDVARTTVQEQRATDWMRFESLADFIDPNDPTRTIEGHPAPVRAAFVAVL